MCVTWLIDLFCIRTRLTEIQQSDWLAAVVQNSIDNAVENNVVQTIDLTVIYWVLDTHPV